MENDYIGDDEMDFPNIEYHVGRLKRGEIYWDKKHNEKVEFGYMGCTGYAIVYEPGDSGGGMQSSWGVDPDVLEEIVRKSPQPGNNLQNLLGRLHGKK